MSSTPLKKVRLLKQSISDDWLKEVVEEKLRQLHFINGDETIIEFHLTLKEISIKLKKDAQGGVVKI